MQSRFLLLLSLCLMVLPRLVCAQARGTPRAVPSREDSTLQALEAKIARLSDRLQVLEARQKQTDLERLMQAARTAAAQKPVPEEAPTKVFRGGQRALQAINPEISVTGDVLTHYITESPHHYGAERSGNQFRVIGVHIRSDLDPFSYTKMAVEVHPDGVELGEAYAVWSGVLPGVSITAGKFRQQFGVVNRWHAHSLDQTSFPLAMQELLGPDGLDQTGFSVDWILPGLGPLTQTLTTQVTNNRNEHLFSGEAYGTPALLLHLKNYCDLNADTYAELGLTGTIGENHVVDLSDLTANDDSASGRKTLAGGLDFTVFWEPLNRAHYTNLLWRSELYYVRKDLPEHQRLTALGGYSYVQKKMSERWEAGMRLDWTQPFQLHNSGREIYQIVPYVTWWQSHWVRLRMEFQHRDGDVLEDAQDRAWLQVTWAAGPHKHERY